MSRKHRRLTIRMLMIPVLALVLFATASPGWAVEMKQIVQAVRDGVPNTGTNHVVMGEVFAADG